MKKFTAVLLTLSMLLCMLPVYSMAVSQEILILGDANRDAKVNIKDATSIQKHIAQLDELSDDGLLCADCNGDIAINIKDATAIQKFAANIEVPYAIGQEITQDEPDVSVPDTETTEASEIATTTTDVAETTNETIQTQTTTTVITEPDETTTVATEPATPPATTVATEPTEVVTTTAPTTVVTEPTQPTVPATTESEISTTVPAYNPVKPDTNITIYFSNNVNWTTVNAYFYNDAAGTQLKAWPGTAMTYLTTNDMGEKVYSIDIDVSKYNRVVFNNGQSQTLNAAVTVASSGFFITSQTPKNAMQLGVYPYGANSEGKLTITTLKYPTGYDKRIFVWTPDGYNPNDTSKKYSVIYLLDGHNQFDSAYTAFGEEWESDETILSLMKNGGEGMILVGIDNGDPRRNNELTPDIGDIIPSYRNQGFDNGSGEQFAEFVAKTVVPYIESNYNVYTDAAHSAIVGSSSGGIEAFYIGMEYMDEFSRIGAISPAFLLYDKATWLKYFDKFDFEKITNLPRIYMFNGGGDSLEQELLPNARDMKTWLTGLGYDADKLTFVYDEKCAHNEAAWRSYMPEVVSWLFELQ